MPWDHETCETVDIPDNQPCPSCGHEPEEHTIRFGEARVFSLGNAVCAEPERSLLVRLRRRQLTERVVVLTTSEGEHHELEPDAGELLVSGGEETPGEDVLLFRFPVVGGQSYSLSLQGHGDPILLFSGADLAEELADVAESAWGGDTLDPHTEVPPPPPWPRHRRAPLQVGEEDPIWEDA